MSRRPLAPILLLLALLAPASAAPPHDQRYDVTEFGAVPGKDCVAAVERALAAIDRDDPTRKLSRELYFPAADMPYRVSRPIFITRDYLRVRGDGPGRSTVAPWFGNQISPFVFGIPAKLNNVTFDAASHSPDLFGIADTSIAPRAGVAWGLRTRADAHVGFMGSAFDGARGGWGSAPGLLLNILVDAPAGPICGLGGTTDGPSPWRITCTGPGAYKFEFSDSTQQYAAIPHSWTFAATSPVAGPHRVSVWLDLTAGAFAAWVDKMQVATVAAGPALTAGMKFRPNRYFPFMLGSMSNGIYTSQWGGIDLTVGGLWLGVSNRYGLDGVGTPLRPTDGKTTSDADTYTSAYTANPPAGFVACLTLKDGPNAPFLGRLVTLNSGPASWSVPPGQAGDGRGAGWGVWMQVPNGNGYYWSYGNGVKDLTVDLGNDAFGQGIGIGGVYQFDARDVSAVGGYHGIGSIPAASSYVVSIRDCTVRGVDAGIFSSGQGCRIRDILVGQVQEAAIKLQASDARVEKVFCSGQVAGDYTIACYDGTYGGEYRISDFTIDNEGNYGAPKLATVYIESHAAIPLTELNLDLVRWGTMGAGAVPVLVNNAPSTRTVWYKPVRIAGVTNCYPIAGATAGTLYTYSP
jgi:hypothetical protein